MFMQLEQLTVRQFGQFQIINHFVHYLLQNFSTKEN